MDAVERSRLFDTLSQLTAPELEKVLFALKPPAGIVSGPVDPRAGYVSGYIYG